MTGLDKWNGETPSGDYFDPPSEGPGGAAGGGAVTTDIRTEIAALRDAAERYRAEAAALHAATLDRIDELEAKLAPPKPTGLPAGPGLWWCRRDHGTYPTVVQDGAEGLRTASRGRLKAYDWLTDPLGSAIPCTEPDTTRVQLTGPVVRFCEHGVVVEALEAFDPIARSGGFVKVAASHLGEPAHRVHHDEPLSKLLGVFAVYTTPEHAAAWRRELGVADV